MQPWSRPPRPYQLAKLAKDLGRRRSYTGVVPQSCLGPLPAVSKPNFARQGLAMQTQRPLHRSRPTYRPSAFSYLSLRPALVKLCGWLVPSCENKNASKSIINSIYFTIRQKISLCLPTAEFCSLFMMCKAMKCERFVLCSNHEKFGVISSAPKYP